MPHEPTITPAVERAPPDLEPASANPSRIVTPSQISLFCDCPRRYYFRYVIRVPSEFYPAAFAFGRAFHAAAEDACTPICKFPSVERAQSRFLQVFRKECHENPVRFDDEDSPEASERLGLTLVERYVLHLAFEEIVAAEVPFEAPLGELLGTRYPVMLRGRFDLRLGSGMVGEIKTARRSPSLPLLQQNVQFRAYVLATFVLEGFRPQVRVIYLLKGGQPLSLAIATLTFGEQEVNALLATIRRMLVSIDAKRFPKNVTGRCNYCEYQGRCLGIGSSS